MSDKKIPNPPSFAFAAGKYFFDLNKPFYLCQDPINGTVSHINEWQEKTPLTDEEVAGIEAKLQELTEEYNKTLYQYKRAIEYPDYREYLDGVVKGDQAQIDAYIAACEEVKKKYPKPT
jgi:hypothetical protein